MAQPLRLFGTVLAALACAGVTVPALAQSRDGQEEVRRELRAGNVQTLRQIERRVVPQMGDMDYLGMDEFHRSTYRLRFIQEGRVVIVDVDARTGRILRVRR